jgi:hypothetical protein
MSSLLEMRKVSAEPILGCAVEGNDVKERVDRYRLIENMLNLKRAS